MKIHTRFWLRLVVYMLLLGMTLPMIACEGDEPVVDADLKFVSSHGYSIYTVVYSESTATPEVVEAATTLRSVLEEVLGCQVAITDDHVSQGMDYAYEILVGSTNRAIGAKLYETLGRDEYAVCVREHKILLLGSDNRTTVEAVDYFIENVLRYTDATATIPNADLSIHPEYEYRGKRSVPAVQNLFAVKAALPISAYTPTLVHLVAPAENDADAMTLATLQGLAAANSSEQILVAYENVSLYLERLRASAPDGYGATVCETDASGATWTISTLLSYYSPRLSGYILCADDLSDPSVAVAISLAHPLNAVVVTAKNEALAKENGLRCVMDVRGTDDTWLRESKYFAQLSRSVAVEQSAATIPSLIDYAVMNGCYYAHYEGADDYMHAQTFHFMDKGSVVLGSNDAFDEYTAISSLSTVNLGVVPARQSFNLSTLSGFARESRVNDILREEQAEDGASSALAEQGHTLCLVISGGESMDAALNDALSDARYGSDLRGSFAMNWGLPATLGDLANPVFSYYADTQTAKDEFILQSSGLGCTYPSRWNLAMLGSMAERLAELMARTGMQYLQVLDANAFDARLLYVMAQHEAVKGVFYVDSNNHDIERGNILWANDTPIVAAAYCLHAGRQDGSLERVAESINSASTIRTEEGAYTFVTVRGDSGLNEQGALVEGGDTMAAVQALLSMLDEDVEVVTASEFMERIKKNLYKAPATPTE